MVTHRIVDWNCDDCGTAFAAAVTARVRCPRCPRRSARVSLQHLGGGYIRVVDPNPDVKDHFIHFRNDTPRVGHLALHASFKQVQPLLDVAWRSYDYGPHPELASSVAEFVATMRELIIWADDPPLRELEKRAGHGRLPRSTLSDALRHTDRLPKLDLVCELVSACNADAALSLWCDAWKRLRADKRLARS